MSAGVPETFGFQAEITQLLDLIISELTVGWWWFVPSDSEPEPELTGVCVPLPP